MANKTVSVRPSGGDYTSLAGAIAGELVANADLTSAGLDGILTISIEGSWSSADSYSATVSTSGFTVDSTHYLRIVADSSNHAGTSWSTSKYRLENSYAGTALDLVPNYTIIDGVQVRSTHAGSGTAVLMTGAYCKVLSSYIRSSFRGATHTGGNGVIVNSIIIGAARGIYHRNGAILSVYYSNGICTGSGYGIQAWIGGRVLTCKNSYFHGGTGSIYDEGSATITITNCATSDGLYSTTDVNYDTNNFINVTAGSEDFDLSTSSGLMGIGTDLSNDSIYPVTTDIEGTTRSLIAPCVGIIEKNVIGSLNISQKKQTLAISGTSEQDVNTNGSIVVSQKKQTLSASGTSEVTPHIINHTHVDLYNKIPQSYINIIKTKWFNIPGESHSYNYRRGLQFVENLNAKFAVSVVESGTPEGSTTEHLRASRATWGYIDSATGWVYGYGEEDYFTSDLARTRTKAHLQYCHDNGLEIGYMGFGWCWDMLRNIAGSADPVYMCRWAGSSVGGPEGDRIWGLDAEDTSITSNSVCMDTYLNATKEYIDYCSANGISSKIFYTTGPVDSYTGEAAYQREVKHDYIRNYINEHGGYLFDYADILCWNNSGVRTTANWTDGESTVHTFSQIAADNLLNFDGSDGSASPYHIGERGELRVGKAIWVMLAIMEGWDGVTTDNVEGTSNISQKKQTVTIQGTFVPPTISVTGLLEISQKKQSVTIISSINNTILLEGVMLVQSSILNNAFNSQKILNGSTSISSTIDDSSIIIQKIFQGNFNSSLSTEANSIINKTLQGNISVNSSLPSSLTINKIIEGILSIGSTVTGTLAKAKLLEGVMNMTSSITGLMYRSARLSGVLNASFSAIGSINKAILLAGQFTSTCIMRLTNIATRKFTYKTTMNVPVYDNTSTNIVNTTIEEIE